MISYIGGNEESTTGTGWLSIELISVDTTAREVCAVLVMLAVVVAIPVDLQSCSRAGKEGNGSDEMHDEKGFRLQCCA
jgi:hypothetical protein